MADDPSRGARTFRRYLAFQAASWVVAGLAAILAVRFRFVSPAVAAMLVLAWIVKDLALYRFVRHAYETEVASPTDRLIGAAAVVARDLAPQGMVRLGRELWTARALGSDAIETGARVRVAAVEGLVLIVEREGR
jgi:membrane protein implicated in regulation of membrane protease activity